MELAKQHGISVILTSWEYQDSSWFVADAKIRGDAVMSVLRGPENRPPDNAWSQKHNYLRFHLSRGACATKSSDT